MKFMGIQKIFMIIMVVLFCFGCATAPSRPNDAQMLIAIQEHRITADQVNQAYADYDKARQEYEQTTTYKAIPYLVAPLLILGGALGDMPYCGGYQGYGYQGYGYRGYGYRGYGYRPGKTIVTTNPIGGGSYQTVIKYYK